MARPLRVLLVEDNPNDAELVLRELRQAGFYPDWLRVETEPDYLAQLQPEPDIILSDYAMPEFSGPRALELLKQSGFDIPFIIISGTIGEDVAVEVMRQGATDYLLKDRLARLGSAVQQALHQGELRRERAKTQEELLWKTAFLEAQVNSSLDGIIVVDKQGRKILQNQRTADLFKIPRSFVENEDDRDQLEWVTHMTVNPAEFVQRVVDLYACPDEIGRDEIELKDGAVLDRYTSPVVGADGHNYGRIWTFRDITERKRTEKALRETKRFLKSALDALSSHIAILDESGTIIAVNAAWNRFATENGFIGSLQGLGDNYLHVCHLAVGHYSAEAADVATGIRGVMTGQQDEFHLEYPCHSTREQRWFVVRVTRFSGDGPLRVVVAHENISERKRTEEALRESELHLREQASLLDKARDAILVRDLEHGITYWNKSAEHLYGWTAEEVHGRKVSELIYRDLVAFEKAVETVLRLGEWHGELQQFNKAGGPILIEARWTLVRDDVGRPQSILAINTDITEKKKLEQQFFRAQRMESIGTLAGGIAHDLNNVLAPILMSIELLRMTSRDERAQTVLSTIETCARRGAGMVKQILTFARGIEGQRMMVDSKKIIQDMQHLVQDTFPKNIQFRAELPNDLPAFLGDPTQAHQVLLNLCVNARDAMPSGGTLTVCADSHFMDERVTDAKPGTYVRITVTDTGTGIPQEVMDKIFDPFFTTKELGKGTGLGLSTVLAIVKSHGGFLNVTSEPGAGTTFVVCFPASLALNSSALLPSEDMLPRGQGELILVVDDEAAVRTITCQTLETFGYRVLVAGDGAEAITIYAQHQQELAAVLTDMMMPVMDGLAIIEALKRMNSTIKIIAASGLSSEGSETKLASMGVKHFLSKPYTAQTILMKLHEALSSP